VYRIDPTGRLASPTTVETTIRRFVGLAAEQPPDR